MISLELWRARIGTFNNKRCSGCSLSSLSSSSLAYSHCRRHRDSTDVSRKEPASIAHTSLSSSSLATKEQSQAFPSTNGHPVSTTSSTSHSYGSSFTSLSSSASSFSSSQSSSSVFPSLKAFITLLISQLLIMAGDIETNPGPKHGGERVYWQFFHLIFCLPPNIQDFKTMHCPLVASCICM